MRSDAAPVIYEDKLKGVLERGEGGLRVICTEEPTRRGSGWIGEWQVYAVSGEGEQWVLISYKLEQRIFRTLAGISSLVIDLGLPRLMIPHREGEAYELWMDGRIRVRGADGGVVSADDFGPGPRPRPAV